MQIGRGADGIVRTQEPVVTGMMVVLHKRETLACAAMVTVLLVLALRLSDAPATLAAPSTELSDKPPRQLWHTDIVINER